MILYKYFPVSQLAFKSIAVRGLWCHFPVMMNDPFECLALVERTFSSDQLSEMRSHLSQSQGSKADEILRGSDEQATKFINYYRKESVGRWAFCSLSESFDDILMWSHYAEGHKGFVVGFEFPELENTHHLRKVQYADSLPELDLIRWLKGTNGDPEQMPYVFDDISIKSSDWSYEREWRIWRNSPGYYSCKNDQIREVCFGVSCEPETIFVVHKLLEEVNNDLVFYEMEFDPTRNKLKR